MSSRPSLSQGQSQTSEQEAERSQIKGPKSWALDKSVILIKHIKICCVKSDSVQVVQKSWPDFSAPHFCGSQCTISTECKSYLIGLGSDNTTRKCYHSPFDASDMVLPIALPGMSVKSIDLFSVKRPQGKDGSWMPKTENAMISHWQL